MGEEEKYKSLIEGWSAFVKEEGEKDGQVGMRISEGGSSRRVLLSSVPLDSSPCPPPPTPLPLPLTVPHTHSFSPARCRCGLEHGEEAGGAGGQDREAAEVPFQGDASEAAGTQDGGGEREGGRGEG